ncbi:hypothetical protein SAMN05660865_01106 [Caloramator fervidus]|uniref:Alkaline shock response membrane anchor protein AmaP n=1 Tax=Caloramator fervidus TaxID=29344 RepID=A0A1H5V4Q1_9CLOT|nr:alkaline shock response membrane anchor protein AmaP [Caloramator fervidus]SEF82184.1 hypothetical protein SAMN05660865_01106 [Caloramator fervidus]
MKNFTKFFLCIYIIVVIALALFLAIAPFYSVAKNILLLLVNRLDFYTSVFCFFIVVVNGIILINILKREKFRLGVSKYTSEGELIISNDAIKSLILKSLKDIKGLKDVKILLKTDKDKLNILIKALVYPDHNIPNLVLEVQRSVKRYLESIAEIPVGEVKVMVDEIASSTKFKVE